MLDEAVSPKQDHAVHRGGVALPNHILIIVAGLAEAVVAQGGYYLPGRILTAALVGLALLVAVRARPWPVTDSGLVLLAGAGLAGWAVLRAAIGGDIAAAIPTVVGVFCLIGAMATVQRSDPAQRASLAAVAVGIGALLAVTGWIAVVWRIPSWSTVADGLSRAGSTITYPNAAAALLASLAVLAVSRQLTQPRSPARVGATCLLLVGLGATLSRAGLLALLVGLIVLSVLAGVAATARQAAPPILGAAVALGALAPTFPVAQPARPVLAIAGLIAGLVLAVGLDRLRAKVAAAVLAGLTLATAAGAAVIGSRSTLVGGRVGLSSPDRGGATGAALDIVADHPVTGVGPGRGLFTWMSSTGDLRVIRYVHNEYLQLLVELGAIGLGLVLCLVTAFVVTIRRGRRHADPLAPWAGAVAALAVLLVHSGFDFLWQIPAVLLIAGLFVGLAGTPIAPVNQQPAKENE